MIMWAISVTMTVVFGLGIGGLITAPNVGRTIQVPDVVNEEQEWADFHAEAYAEHGEGFTRLFNALEVKWAKNGRLMMRNGDSGPYKFVKRAI
ncbi:hypothetical protein [Streptomyces althioticus]|uniref:hypothetical protein n=1 Tax=Streptomyces althioticus TaxID=83380 RepID=UPI0033F98231